MTNRQPVCEVGDDGRPVPLFYELFTSIVALRQTLMPGQNLYSDRWLFQYLTGKLDLRMLAWLTRNRSEEHTSKLQSLMRISYAVFCLKKKKKNPEKHQ